jgi:hypothetical protein
MQQNFLGFLFSSVLIVISVLPASSACRYSRYNFFFLNDEVNVAITIDNKGGYHASGRVDPRLCNHNFNSGGANSFTGISVVKNPRNGNIQQNTVSNFKYTPKKGFIGNDAYAIKICGTLKGQAGCSTINYNVTVQ